MMAAKLSREHVGDFIQVYRRTYNQNSSDVDIKAHMEHMGRSNVVFWLKLAEHFKVRKMSCKRVKLVESADAIKYNSMVA